MVDLIVFSKDRPAQLDLLLGSIERFFAEWRDVALTVVHVATDDAAARGYARVRELHPEIAFVDERAAELSFKEITLSLTGRNPLVAFLMDDQVFKAPFTLRRPEVARFLEDPQTMCLSLRMDPGMDYCYPLDRHVPVPDFEAEGVWRWRAAEGDWAYPMSLDAHIFRTAELRPLLERVPFRNPNSLEGALANVPLQHPRLACLPEAPTVNIPDNRVQEVCDNRHGAGDPAVLTARFLAGDRLDLEPLVGIRTPSPHHEIPLTWRGDAVAARPLPRVSVVVPCYQHGRHLADAVDSVLGQEGVDVDVTIVDDGSTDSTPEVARALVAAGGGRVRLLTTVNSGHPAHARNAGVRASEAPYVVCLDADDRLGAGYLARLAGALDTTPEAGFAYGDYEAFGDAGFVERTPPYDAARLPVVNFLGSASMFRRAAWEAVGGYDGTVGYEDWDFWIGCADAGWHGVKAPGAVWHYRVEGDGRYARDQRRDAQIKAQLALKRPHLYSVSYVASARAILGIDAAPVAEPAAVEQPTRAFATVAVVAEVLAHPELLDAYAARFAAADDATLVLLALDGDADGAAVRLLPLLERLGLDGDDGPDMVAVGAPPARVAQTATAILTAGAVPPALDGLEPFGAADADRLRARAEAAWRALAPAA